MRVCDYDGIFLSAAIRLPGVHRICFGNGCLGSGRAVRPETGRTTDDLRPVVSSFDFLTEADGAAPAGMRSREA
jgi:hypothetical protein